jgi:hypothetical protein
MYKAMIYVYARNYAGVLRGVLYPEVHSNGFEKEITCPERLKLEALLRLSLRYPIYC